MSTPPNMTLVLQMQDGSSSCHSAPLTPGVPERQVLLSLAHSIASPELLKTASMAIVITPDLAVAYDPTRFLSLIDLDPPVTRIGASVNITARLAFELARSRETH